jgi:GNAT superfamily N-acetyltransferase
MVPSVEQGEFEKASGEGEMNENLSIVSVEKPEESVWGILGQNINAYNRQQAGDDKSQRVCFALQAPDQEIAGGAIGVIYWDWLYIDLMWIKEELRGRGHGHRLLTQLEEEARRRGANHVYLDTFSFQAPAFYQQHGYQVVGVLNDFPAGHQRYFLSKELYA